MTVSRLFIIFISFVLLSCNNREVTIKRSNFFNENSKIAELKIEGWKLKHGGEIKIVDSISENFEGMWYHKIELNGLFFSPIFYIRVDSLQRELFVKYFIEGEIKEFKLDLKNIKEGEIINIPDEFEDEKLANHHLKLISLIETDDDTIYEIECVEKYFGYCCLYFYLSRNKGIIKIEALESYFKDSII